jgi:hypothetical protein
LVYFGYNAFYLHIYRYNSLAWVGFPFALSSIPVLWWQSRISRFYNMIKLGTESPRFQ